MTDTRNRNRTYRDFLDEIGTSDQLTYESRFITDAVLPAFYRDKNGKWLSSQKDFFAFYGLRNIFRGCIVSCRFIEGGNLLDKSGFYALAVTAYYSAAFQLLSTFLAINGKIIINSPHIILPDKSNNEEFIVAKLPTNDSWIFERLGRNHSVIWRLLSETFTERYKHGIPNFFSKFLKYVADLNDLQTNLSVQENVVLIPRLRHQALYAGFGFDNQAFKDATYGLIVHGKIDALSKSFKEFVLDFLSYCLKETLAIKSEVELMDNFYVYYHLLRAGIWSPPFESAKDINLGISDTENEIKVLQNWLQV